MKMIDWSLEATMKESSKYKAKPSENIRKCLVQVYFPNRNRQLTYFNDRFELQVGDRVYVEGKLAGELGVIIDIQYNFKIRLADFKRVLSVLDTDIHGELHMAGSHFLALEPEVIPLEKIETWYLSPQALEDEIFIGIDDSSFHLLELAQQPIPPEIRERGRNYYQSNRVEYLTLQHGQATAFVVGSHNYQVEFFYQEGFISQLTCNCYFTGFCKHEYATLLQFQEILGRLEKPTYFAAIHKETLFHFAIHGKQDGNILL